MSARLRQGATESEQSIYWADPDTFSVLPMPVLAGDPVAALRLPDSLVMTDAMARRNFGDGPAVGRTLLVNGEPMVLRAVISDLPANETHFQAGIFASALAAFSPLARQDADPKNELGSSFFSISARTFLRLAPGVDVGELQKRVDDYLDGFLKSQQGRRSVELVRLDRVNTHSGLNPGFHEKLLMLGTLGVIVLLIAAINFANLVAARAGNRATEVGIRRIAGATHRSIVGQFLGESLGHVLVSLLLAIALAEWSLPHINAFLDAGARLEYWSDPWLCVILLLAAIVLGLLAGGSSALVLSRVRPQEALASRLRHSRPARALRNALVTLQFALLVALMVCSGVISMQRSFATGEALRVDTDQKLALITACRPALVDELKSLPGVAGVSCTGREFLNLASSIYSGFRGADGEPRDLNVVPLDGATLALYGITPLRGGERFGVGEPDGRFLINESAQRELGYPSMDAAIGQPGATRIGARGVSYEAREIIGVVRDFSLAPVTQRIPPTAYVHAPADYGAVHLRLTGRQLPETLAQIDAVWRRTGGEGKLWRFFIEEHVQARYLSLMRQVQAFGFFSLLAAILACLGLLGLAASVTSQRTKEIGIRKALGADNGDVLRLLLWQFSRPVVLANLIAWPLAGWAMQSWLDGFAYRIDLPLWLFPAAALLALGIALLTVSAHSLRVARARPVAALRHQ
jgi:putative ABC transport system permease protein